MSATRAARLLGVAVGLALASGCGAAKQAPPAKSSPQAAPPADGQADVAPPSSAAPSSAPGRPSGGAATPSGRAVALAQASAEIDAAQRQLDVAAGDCRSACRALASMDRAAGHLCALAEDAGRCRRASDKLYSARDRVRATCGECPGGPSVDRDAPIPSVR